MQAVWVCSTPAISLIEQLGRRRLQKHTVQPLRVAEWREHAELLAQKATQGHITLQHCSVQASQGQVTRKHRLCCSTAEQRGLSAKHACMLRRLRAFLGLQASCTPPLARSAGPSCLPASSSSISSGQRFRLFGPVSQLMLAR